MTTWSEFKTLVESQDVKDDTVIDYIDIIDIDKPSVTFSNGYVYIE